MPRFLRYLNENEINTLPIDDGISYIKENCKWWLHNVHLPVYRGMRADLNENEMIILNRRKDRKPVDTFIELHNSIDAYFNKKFGWRGRSDSVFVTTAYTQAMNYGEVCLCFPIGNSNIDIIFSNKVPDLYVYSHNTDLIKQFSKRYDMNNADAIFKNLISKDGNYELKHAFFSFLADNIKKYNLYESNPSGLNKNTGEIMVNCNKYVVIKESGKISLQRLYNKIKGIK